MLIDDAIVHVASAESLDGRHDGFELIKGEDSRIDFSMIHGWSALGGLRQHVLRCKYLNDPIFRVPNILVVGPGDLAGE
jgi:hypothetical protein